MERPTATAVVRKASRFGAYALLLIAPRMAVAAPAPPLATPLLERLDLFREGQDGFVGYRIPGIAVTAKGTVLAYCEARKFSFADLGEIEIHLRRSVDGGRTWSTARQVAHMGPRLPRNPHSVGDKRPVDGPAEQTVNNPVVVAQRDGTVHLIYCVEYMRAFHIRSDDDGLSWSKPAEITEAFDEYRHQIDWQRIATGPGHGLELANGRLVVPFWTATTAQAPLTRAAGTITSDDGGITWHGRQIAIPRANEANIAQLSDGRVILTARNSDPRNRRVMATSADGGGNWSPPWFAEELLEPGCMAGMVNHPGNADVPGPLLVFSHPNTTKRAHRDRQNLTIHLSADDGRSWPMSRVLEPGPSAYSDLAVLPDGTLLCFYERGDAAASREHGRPWAYAYLTLARFNIAWLSGGNSP